MYKSVSHHPHTTHTTHIDNSSMADIIVAHTLLEHLRKGKQVEDEDKELKKKDIYESPKRDNLCSKCGQQLPWCVCHLNDY